MKALYSLSLLLLLLSVVEEGAFAQKYISDLNHVSFYSEAPMENIEAHSYKAKSLFDIQTQEIVFTVPIRTFEFEKSLMQEHFNENYMESHKFPKAKFVGKVTGFEPKPGTQQVAAEGKLEIHGISQDVKVDGEIEYAEDEIKVKAVFPVKVADYKIEIPSMVASNIAEVVDVTIEFNYQPYDVQ